MINVGWSFKDEGSGIKKYEVVVNPGGLGAIKTCYPNSNCDFLYLYLKNITIQAEDNLGNKSQIMNADIKCKRYLGVIPTYNLLCY